MRLPILLLSVVIIVFGVVPGLPLRVIDMIQSGFGLEPLMINIWGITSDAGIINMLNLFVAVLVVGLIVWLIFRSARKLSSIGQYDNYAAGHAVPKDKYHYSVNFYDPLNRIIRPFLGDFIDDLYMKLAGRVKWMANGIRRIYAGDVGYYLIYIILFLALLIFVEINWKPW